MTLTDRRINKLIERREKFTSRRDGLVDGAVIDLIDAQLRDVPPGQRNDVDLLLGRTCATLPECAEYDGDRRNQPGRCAICGYYLTDDPALAGWRCTCNPVKRAEQIERDDFLTTIADQYADMLDWLRICGDLAI